MTWSQAWRRFNKKIKVDELVKRRTKKTTRVQKAIVGISLEEIKRRRNEDEKERDRKLETAKKEVKDRQKKKVDAKRTEKAKVKKDVKATVPKNQPAAKKGAATGGKGVKK